MVSVYKTFALVGVGSLGSFVAEELLKRGADIKILTRNSRQSNLQTFKKRGVPIVSVDYSKPASVQQALQGVDVVVSTLSFSAINQEPAIARAAKDAGVKLFVPAEYGYRFESSDENSVKRISHDAIKDLGLPFTLFYAGFFADEFAYYMGYNYRSGSIRVVGTGSKPFSMTSRADIGRFVAHVLTTANPSDLEGAELPFEGDRKSPLEIKAIAEKKLKKPMRIQHVDYDRNAAEVDYNIVALLHKAVEDGHAVTGTEEEIASTISKFYPDWNPSPIEEFIH